MMGNTADLGSASRDWCRVGEPGLMLVELSVVEQRYHAVMEVISGGAHHLPRAARHAGRQPNTPGTRLLLPQAQSPPTQQKTGNPTRNALAACLSRDAGKARSPGSETKLR